MHDVAIAHENGVALTHVEKPELALGSRRHGSQDQEGCSREKNADETPMHEAVAQ
jgi:hypothetical protein